MPGESKKFLWIALAACAFVLIVLAAAFFIFAPGKDGSDAVADFSIQAVPKADNPQDFLADSARDQAAPQDSGRSGDIIIVYGDKPDLESGGDKGAAAAPAATSAPPVQTAPATTPTTVKPVSSKPAPSTTTTTLKPASTATTIRVAPAAPAAQATPTAQPASKAGSAWIQAGSFSARASADKVKAALSARGIESTVSAQDSKGKTVYKVKAGPYASRDEAKKWLPTVRAASGSPDAFVTQ